MPTCKIKMFNHSFEFLLDTGATVNLIDGQTFKKIKNYVNLQNSSTSIYPFQGNKPLALLGQIKAPVIHKGIEYQEIFYVTENQCSGCIIGYKTRIKMNLI